MLVLEPLAQRLGGEERGKGGEGVEEMVRGWVPKAGDKTRERRGMSEPSFSRPVATSSLAVRIGS